MTTLKSLQTLVEGATTPITPAAIGAVVLQFLSPPAVAAAPASGVSTIYAFGDSLSDAGNVSLLSLHALPVGGIYSGGRFSNGDVWVQDLARNLGLLPVAPSLAGGTDYAFGGAQTGATAVHALNPTDLPYQLGAFAARVPHPAANALYTVWAGSNDVLSIANSAETPAQQQVSVTQAVTNETGFIAGLVAHGAKDLVVMDLPDLGKTPYEMARPASDAAATVLAQTYNAELGLALRQIVASGAASIDYVDTFGLLDAAIASPAKYGLTNVTQPVWTGNLTDVHSGVLNAAGAAQSGYLFFDSLHPTATGHALLATAVAHSLTGVA